MNKISFLIIGVFLSFQLMSGQNDTIQRLYFLSQVDSIVEDGIRQKAFPGAQILVAYKDSILFHKAYGFHTYDSITQVSNADLYDLASVTKILGPLPALMKLVDEGKINLDAPFSNYWKPWKKFKNKRDITLREILAHQAGLQPYIVFLNKVMKKNGALKRRFVRTKSSKRFQNEAYPRRYIKNRFDRKVDRHINRSAVNSEKTYRYSGLTFLVFPRLIEQLTHKKYTTYLQEEFYQPVGAATLGFTPKKHGLSNPIVPTEIDTLFRNSLTQGWVHDENAALLGGVSGNAGLFGTAEDVFKMLKLYKNFGEIEGKQLLRKKTVHTFITTQYPENNNRRGLGFDKPLLGNDSLPLSDAYPAPKTSPRSFGHAGFTGTFAWADPEHDLIFVFLSNRVYPSRESRGLYTLNIRPKLQQVFYSWLID